MRAGKIKEKIKAWRNPSEQSVKGLFENLAAPQKVRRPVQVHTEACFRRSRRIWDVLLLSLPADLALYSLLIAAPGHQLRTAGPKQLVLILLCLAILILFRQSLYVGTTIVKVLRNRLLTRKRKSLIFVLVGVVLLLTFGEVYFKQAQHGVAAWGTALFFMLIAAWPAFRTIQQRLDEAVRKWRNRLIWIEEIDRKLFLLAVIPQIPARLISLAGAFYAASIFDFALYFFTALCLLLSLEPRESDFFMLCRRCLKRTSKGLAGMRYCPSCTRVHFYIHEAAPQQIEKKNRAGWWRFRRNPK